MAGTPRILPEGHEADRTLAGAAGLGVARPRPAATIETVTVEPRPEAADARGLGTVGEDAGRVRLARHA
jgi:hypothetical protein